MLAEHQPVTRGFITAAPSQGRYSSVAHDRLFLLLAGSAAAALIGGSALAQSAPQTNQGANVGTSVVNPPAGTQPTVPGEPAEIPADRLSEIVVTAQKRQDNVNKVGMSITAITGDSLAHQGVTQIEDLVKVVPGFNYTKSAYGVPVYTIRGIGFYDTGIGSSPTVTVYTDEIPLPFSAMTIGAGIDIARVEILKGPQGTLFGQNSTGGAVNYVSAKPGKDLEAGADVTYESFNEVESRGYISSPITDNLGVRLSATVDEGGDWQKSYTRDDHLGNTDRIVGRAIVDWAPTDRLKFELNVNGWRDKSDTQAGQFAGVFSNPATAPAVLVNYPAAPHNDRAADWDPGLPFSTGEQFKQDTSFYQTALRADYDLAGSFKLTSLTSYVHFKKRALTDADGTAYENFTVFTAGVAESFYQELRVAGDLTDRLKLVAGGNYEYDKVSEQADPFNIKGLASLPFQSAIAEDTVPANTEAAFGNLDWKVLNTFTLQGGVRYTATQKDFSSCSYDTGDGTFAAVVSALATARRGIPTVIPPGACGTLNSSFLPAVVHETLDEHNISWRANANWQVNPTSLLYANISRGYKAGGFQVAGATLASSLTPAKQETVLAYEAGFKVGLFDHRVQFDGAAFYYDYSDKQIRGRINDPILGRVNKLLNIPKSYVVGAEADLTAVVVHGLRVNAGGTYVKSKIQGSFLTANAIGQDINAGGESFPLTPRWQLQAGAEYSHPISGTLEAFLGGNVNYQSSTNSGLGNLQILKIDSYALVDARIGVRTNDGKWSATAFVKNLTNKYYWVFTSFVSPDTAARYTGRPRTFGLTLSSRFK